MKVKAIKKELKKALVAPVPGRKEAEPRLYGGALGHAGVSRNGRASADIPSSHYDRGWTQDAGGMQRPTSPLKSVTRETLASEAPFGTAQSVLVLKHSIKEKIEIGPEKSDGPEMNCLEKCRQKYNMDRDLRTILGRSMARVQPGS